MSKTRSQLIALIDSSFDDSLKRKIAVQALLDSTALTTEVTDAIEAAGSGGGGGGGGSGGAVALRPPTMLQELAIWLRADSCRHFGDGNEVTSWGDGSGRGIVVAPLATGPVYVEVGVGGKPSLRWSATNQTMVSDENATVVANDHTAIMVLKAALPDNGSFRTFWAFRNASDFMIVSESAGKMSAGLYSQPAMFFPIDTDVILTCISSPTGITFRVNGQSQYDHNDRVLRTTGPATDQADAVLDTLHISNNRFAAVNKADVAELIIYKGSLSMAEVRSVEAYLSERYGITVTENVAATKNAALFGDSRSVGQNPNQGPGASTLSSLRSFLNPTWFVFGEGIGGNTTSEMDARFFTDVPSVLDSEKEKAVVVVWGGVNDITSAVSAATIYANLLSICAKAKALGYKTVLCNEPDCDDFDSGEETIRNALNVLIAATAHPATVDALADVASAIVTPLGDIHPNAAEGALIAQVIATAVLSIP